MSNSESPDETPKTEVAKRVVTAKRRYFFPHLNKSVLATSLEKATEIVTKDTGKDGDA